MGRTNRNSVIVAAAFLALLLTDTRLTHAGGLPVAAEPIAAASVNLEPSEAPSLHTAPDLESRARAAHEEQSKQQSQQSRRKRWLALSPLIVAGAVFLVIWLIVPRT